MSDMNENDMKHALKKAEKKGRGGHAALYPRPARVHRKAENTLHGPCHKKVGCRIN